MLQAGKADSDTEEMEAEGPSQETDTSSSPVEGACYEDLFKYCRQVVFLCFLVI